MDKMDSPTPPTAPNPPTAPTPPDTAPTTTPPAGHGNTMSFNLEQVPVTVKNINFDGLGRTKADFAQSAVRGVFESKTLGELIISLGEAQDKLRQLEVFKEIAAMVDVDKTEKDYKTSDGYDITFIVKEFPRFAAQVKTEVGAQSDAQLKTAGRLINILGRGEKLELEYAYSSAKEENRQIKLTKPYPFFHNSNLSTTLFSTKAPNPQASYFLSSMGGLITYTFKNNVISRLPALQHKLEYEGIMRELFASSGETPFAIRSLCGVSFKSAVRHMVTFDTRDRPVFARQGFYSTILHEYAGLLGDVNYSKMDLDFKHHLGLPLGMTFQTSFRTGLLTPRNYNPLSYGLVDRFFMGGPYSLRGFNLRGVNVEESGISLGGRAYWSTAAHLYMPLYYLNRKFPMVENCRIHFFANAGNLTESFTGGSRRDFFKDVRSAYGVGLAVALGTFGKAELNYCIPWKFSGHDKPVHGFQCGIGINFL